MHSVVPHHQVLMHGDDLYDLSPDCHIQLENEANYGAGRLLFLQGRFEDFVRGSEVGFRTIQDARSLFRNTMTSTLWRVVETLDVPAFGLVSRHPKHKSPPGDTTPPLRHFIRSRKAIEQFSNIDESDIFSMFRGYCSWSKRGPLGEEELIITDDIGEEHVFQFESFYNGYEALTLVTHRRGHAPLVAIPAGTRRM